MGFTFNHGRYILFIIFRVFPVISSQQIGGKTSLTIQNFADRPDANFSDQSLSYAHQFDVGSSDSDQVYDTDADGDSDDDDDDVGQFMEEGTTMAFVFDVTFSMSDDLEAVIAGAERILTSTLESRDFPIKNFVLVPFHDPDIQEITITEDPDYFQRKLKDLYVQGGGDCPEKSITAIYHALNISLPGSSIYVFTDARSNDYELTNEVLRLIQEKESQVVFVMTGDCGNQSHPGFQAYEQIAATSSGQVFMLNKSDVDLVLRFVEVSLQSRKVNLLSTDYEHGAVQRHTVPIDSRVRQITIAVSGEARRVTLRDPQGRDIPLMHSARFVRGNQALEELLDLENVYVVGMVEPTPGRYELITHSSSEHTVRVTAISLLDFSFGFARNPTGDLNNTFHRPVKGVASTLMIEAIRLNPPGIMDKVEFLNLMGEVIFETRLTPSSLNPDMYVATDVVPPNEYFHIRVSGIDSRNYRFQRITKAAISPLVPDPPTVVMPRRTRGFFGTTAVLTCEVQSLIPFNVQWMRRGTPLNGPISFSESGRATWTIEDADSRIEGVYSCVADNAEGRSRAETYLDITEPPPQIGAATDVSILPGSDALLSCRITSTVEYNITWDKPNTLVSLQGHNRVSLMKNGSLVISDVRPGDAGAYRCTAENEGGTTEGFVHVYVQERPQINPYQRNVTFMTGQNFTLRCSSSGFPRPEIRWMKNGQELDIVRGLNRGEWAHYITNASRSNEGIYSCMALNTAGSDILNVLVIYQEPPRILMDQYRYLTPPSRTATLSCPTSGVPPPKVMWFKYDRDLSRASYAQIKPNGDLLIMGVQESDSGEYTCVAMNDAGTISQTVNLEVGSRPTILQPPIDLGVDYGMNVSVTCMAIGHPTPRITWRKEGHDLLTLNPRVTISEDGNLFIRDLQVEDSGTYVCVAQNEHGSIEASSQLRITNLIQPQISATGPEQVVYVGDNAMVPCNVLAGNPPPTVTWYHRGERLYPSISPRLTLLPDGSLALMGAVLADAGNYTCLAENVVGNDTRSTNLRVHDPPSISITETSYTVVRHESVTLICPAEGYPPPTIEWIKNGQTVPNLGSQQSALTLNYVTRQDAGTYICRVRNIAGVTEIEITLFVMIPPTHDGVETTGVVSVSQGESVTLPCDVMGNPPPTISWLKEGQPLGLSGRNYYVNPNGGLVIQQMSLTDEAEYTCLASNVAGNSTRDIRITILIQPTIEPGSPSYQVVTGESVTLSCEAFGIPMPEVSWQKDGVLLASSSNAVVLEEGSLRIRDTREEHTGTYTCLATNEAGSANRVIRLDVYVSPVILDHQTQYTVVEGRMVTLHCPASGIPAPMVTWSKNGQDIPLNDAHYDVDETAGTLTIFGVLPSDFGTYQCLVSNAGGTASKDISVSVYERPSLSPDDQQTEVHSVAVGGSISLPCEVSGTPPPVVTWYKEHSAITLTNSMAILSEALEIHRVRPFDSGVYQCVATNVAGNITKSFRLIVMIPPTIQSGETEITTQVSFNVELECRADGLPLPNIVWHKDGQPINVYNDLRLRQTHLGSLHIRNVDQSDAGEYSCYASNEAGKATKFVTLTVNLPPMVLSSPDNYTSLLRNPVTLQCLTAGYPPPQVTWLKNGAPLDSTDVRYYVTPSNSLLIASTMREDTAVYTCNVSNVAGYQEKRIRLTVYVPPTSLTNGDTNYDVTLNNRISLPCEVDSYPPPTITWLKDGKVIPFSNNHYIILPAALNIPRAAVLDSGIYTCIASNIVGNVSRSYSINVQVPPKISPGPESITTYITQNVTLPCDSIGVPTPMVMWDKGGRPVRHGRHTRFHKLGHGALLITNVRESDAGNYYCLVVNQAGSDTVKIALTVKDAPRIVNELPDVMEHEMNTEVRIPCQATGSPRPSIQWFKDGQPIEQLRGYTVLGDNTLLISSLQPYDNGFYQCQAQSDSGTDSIEVFIDTQVRPHIAGENTPDQPVVLTIEEGLPAVLECNVTDSHPPATVTWYKNGLPLQSRSDIGGIHFANGDTSLRLPYLMSTDAAHYFCVATNDHGTSERHFALQVFVSPVIRNPSEETMTVEVSHSVTLTCEASGVPDVRVVWRFGDIPISSQNNRYQMSTNGSLHLREVQVIDSGNFTCIAKNSAGMDTRVITLNVIVPPSINQGPSDIVRTLSSSVILPCEAAGVPFPDITWYRDGTPLDPRTDPNLERLVSGSLRIKAVREVDSGTYRCVAFNQAGHEFRTVTLHIHTPPAPEPNAPKKVSSGVSEDIIIPCNISGSPKPQYRWMKNNRELLLDYGRLQLLADGALLIRDVEAMDRGAYTCEATNVAGVLSREVRLDVSVAPKIPGSLNPTEYPIGEYDSLELQCMVTDAFPPPVISWYKGDQMLTGEEPGVTIRDEGVVLEIGPVSLANAGQYYCIASNDAGMDTRQWTIDVQVVPTILHGQEEYMITKQGVDITLLCQAEGNPQPAITWQRDGQALDSNGHYTIQDDGALVISSPQHTDSGGYVCLATNIMGIARKRVHLVVQIPPKITTHQEIVTVGLGESLTISCQATGFPAPTITWVKDHGQSALNTPPFSYSNNRGNLHINSTREGDSGIYSCHASNDVGKQSKDIVVKVQEPPRILGEFTGSGSQSIQQVHGGDIAMECPTSGYPKPEVVWFKDNRILDPLDYDIDENGTLYIANTSPQDSGEYICMAVNDAGNTSISVQVSVIVRPVIRNSGTPIDLFILLNQRATMTCEVEVSIPTAQISWLKDGTPVREDSNLRVSTNGQNLHIDQVQVTNGGRYTCIATNPAGNSTKFFGLTVHVPPIFPDGTFEEPSILSIDEDESTQLQCRASGYPPPRITWYKDGHLVTHNEPGVKVSSNGEVLTIQRVNRIHAGEFTCRAESIVGNVSKSYVLNVRVSPEIEGSEHPHNVSVINNMGIELQCPTLAIPPPTIEWFKDGRRLHPFQSGVLISHDGTTLRIPNAQLHDEGVYQCVATNQAGQQTKLFFLQIDVPPVIVSQGPMQVAVTAGDSTTLDCESYGVPKPTVMWTKNSIFISPASARYDMDPVGLLHIATVSVADEGVFECMVFNSAGNITRRIDVQVQVPPTISTGPSKVTTQVGQSVRLFCDAMGVPLPQILWQKDGQRVDAVEGFISIDDGMLQITDAQPSDAGRYVCIAKNGAGADVLKITLEVHEAPSISLQTQTYEVRVESSVELECRVSGIPRPSIRWLHNGRDLAPSGDQFLRLSNGNLRIPVVRPEDSGVYTCIAQNEAGFGRAERILVVLDVPRIPSLSLNQSQMTVSVNRQAILTCPAEGYPPPEVSWRKDGILVQPSGRVTLTDRHELIIDRVQESDSGTYTCVATNSVGSNELNFYLTVQVAPTFTRFPNDIELASGTRLEMECQAIGVPMPQIAWLVNGTEIVPNPPTLNGRSVLAINNVQKSDSGTYMCRASNLLGIRTAITAVRVRVPPRIQRIQTDTTLTLGERAVLNCAVEGDPKPQVTWLKNNQPIATSPAMLQASNGSLIISNTGISDAGYYKCQALNLYGQAEVGYHLEIQSRPTFIVEPQNVMVSHGDTALVDCVAQGEPEPMIRWQKDGFRVIPGGRLAILPNNTLKVVAAQLTDSGQYLCLAENLMGREVMSMQLTVMVHGRWGEWQPWEDCSVSCGFGVRVRRRHCDNPPAQYGGRDCTGMGIQHDECFNGECPVDGGWGPWSPWQQCDRTCGTGNTIRDRLCNNPEPRNNGRDCIGLSRETKTCNLAQCPVDAVWGPWTSWSLCTVSCGGGQKTKTRVCTAPLHGGRPCEGRREQIIRCNTEPCPVHGNWSDWGVWSDCSAMCNGGTKQRFRSCTKPAPSPTGRPCVGENIDVQTCNQQPCRVDGRWSLWSQWTECSQTCGDSFRRKTRTCSDPAPAYGGNPCVGQSELMQACHVPRCIVGPRQARAFVTGNINGQTLQNGLLLANISVDNAGYTQITANMDNVPEDIGNVMRLLISLISPVYWTSAYERDNTASGYSVTNGLFERQTQVSFWSGEQLTMGMHSLGVDDDGVLQLTILLTGETPDINPDEQIVTQNYREDYIQTGPGEIYGKSSRFISIDGMRLPFAWNHTITYDDATNKMAYLVQSLNADGAVVEYNPVDGSLTYTIRVFYTRGEPRNQCPSGFYLDPTGPYCRDQNECLRRDTCSHYCQNFYGGFVCTCPDGFKLNRYTERTCEDIDECRYNNGNCPRDEECQNMEGSHRCVSLCDDGMRRIAGTKQCSDINECQERPNVCSHYCSNTHGSYQCTCREGYRLQGKSRCIDVDECRERSPCLVNQQCVNEEGRYQCINVCPTGYEKARNGSCVDIDECRTNQHQCSPSQICQNTRGSFTCSCHRGFRPAGRWCEDINECYSKNTCTYQCRNLRGDYECICQPGMTRAPDRKTCFGIPNYNALTRPILCPDGLQVRGERCVDINECEMANQCHYQCVNTEGSFQCKCPVGYRLSSNHLACDDINECKEYGITCRSNELCFNRKGNYSCLNTSCPQYYNRDYSTGYCIKACPRTLTSVEAVRCASLPQSIQFQTLALLTGIPRGRDLLALKVKREDGTVHHKAHFSIENPEVPFSVRTKRDGRGILSARMDLQYSYDYTIQVRAKGFSPSREVELDKVFHIYVSISSFPYGNS